MQNEESRRGLMSLIIKPEVGDGGYAILTVPRKRVALIPKTVYFFIAFSNTIRRRQSALLALGACLGHPERIISVKSFISSDRNVKKPRTFSTIMLERL